MAKRIRYPAQASGWVEERKTNVHRDKPSTYKIYRYQEGANKKSVYLKKDKVHLVLQAIEEGSAVTEVLEIIKGSSKQKVSKTGKKAVKQINLLAETIIKCDASVDADRGITVLAACCEKTGHAFTEVVPYTLPISVAEAMAVSLGFKKFKNAEKLYTDSKDTANAWSKQDGTYYSDPNAIAGMIKHIGRCGITVQWISREKNKDPDGVARSVRVHADIDARKTAGSVMEWSYLWDDDVVELVSLSKAHINEGLAKEESASPEKDEFYLTYESTVHRMTAIVERVSESDAYIKKLMDEYNTLEPSLDALDEALSAICRAMPDSQLAIKVENALEVSTQRLASVPSEVIEKYFSSREEEDDLDD